MAVLVLFFREGWAGSVGVYGVSKHSDELFQHNIATVFLHAKSELIEFYTDSGYDVFLTLNVFGGRKAWEMFPDARPISADGTAIDKSVGGVCPTHDGWRRNRLDLLLSWLERFGGASGISGVWLDFLRYPGSWEHPEPEIPATCFCERCLRKFQTDTGVIISDAAITVTEKADWIKKNVALQWMAWKKEQVTSFAKDAKDLAKGFSRERKILLGAFLVPWRISDYDGGLSFHLAQDADRLKAYIDVFSPMVYHRMVGRPISWVGEITDYYAEMTGVEVWPIIQAESVEADEFALVVQTVSNSEAGGMLVYKYSDLIDEHWPLFKQLELPQNLLNNPLLTIDTAEEEKGRRNSKAEVVMPDHWFTSPVSEVQDTKSWVDVGGERDGNAIGLTAGYDRQAVWTTALPDCQAGAPYLFSAEFYRPDRKDGLAYPEVSLWGQRYCLNTHRMTGKFQRLKTIVICPESHDEEDRIFQFRNNYPGNTFWMRSPELVALEPASRLPQSLPDSDFFPVGVYGANSQNLKTIKELGLNTAVIRMNRENIKACLALDMHCTLSVPRNAERLIHLLDDLGPLLEQGRFSYYVNDEPGIHSFPEGKAEDIQRIIKQRFPKALTNMAIVRPQVIPFYNKGADYFMLDQYPVPNMPMTWLSDSMDEAATHVGRGRLQSIIQAFGGEKYTVGGWPRLPTFNEMNCLAFLSVIHGSRGIYFYTFPSISSSTQGKEDFARLICRLNSLRSWLQVHNDEKEIPVRMTSMYQLDPQGQPAVHCVRKEQFNTQMLICANTLPTYTEAEIGVSAGRQSKWHGYFEGVPYAVVDGSLLGRFAPLEVKVLIETK